MREREVDDDAAGRHAAEALGEIGEQCHDAVLHARQVQDRQVPGRAMRLAPETLMQAV